MEENKKFWRKKPKRISFLLFISQHLSHSFSIFTAFPRGYCAWVHRAVGMLMEIVATYPSPIYVNHEIIHNTFVVKMFERKWVVFEPDLDKIPEWSLVVISAHGTWPTYFSRLRSRNMRWIDATCPLVEKVHREARDFISKWYHILYIGKDGHQDAVGVIDEWEKHFTLIEKKEDIPTQIEIRYDLSGFKKSIHWFSTRRLTIRRQRMCRSIGTPPGLCWTRQATLLMYSSDNRCWIHCSMNPLDRHFRLRRVARSSD